MKHTLGLLALAFASGSVAAIGAGHGDHARVYTVAAIQGNLTRSPAAWAGRTILVRGMVAGEPAYYPSPSLVDADATAAVDPLPLVRAGPDPLWAFLRRVPLAGQLMPPPQAVRWGAVATYRVQLRAAPAGSCPAPPCYQALLLDAAPDAHGDG